MSDLTATITDATEICPDCDYTYHHDQTIRLTIDPETGGSEHDWTCPEGHTVHTASDTEVTLQMLGADYADDRLEDCNTCGDTGRWETTLEDAPTVLVDLGPCPDCHRGANR